MDTVADALSCLEIDSLKIQEEEMSEHHQHFSQDQKTTASVVSN
jgi:hypothetical protein